MTSPQHQRHHVSVTHDGKPSRRRRARRRRPRPLHAAELPAARSTTTSSACGGRRDNEWLADDGSLSVGRGSLPLQVLAPWNRRPTRAHFPMGRMDKDKEEGRRRFTRSRRRARPRMRAGCVARFVSSGWADPQPSPRVDGSRRAGYPLTSAPTTTVDDLVGTAATRGANFQGSSRGSHARARRGRHRCAARLASSRAIIARPSPHGFQGLLPCTRSIFASPGFGSGDFGTAPVARSPGGTSVLTVAQRRALVRARSEGEDFASSPHSPSSVADLDASIQVVYVPLFALRRACGGMRSARDNNFVHRVDPRTSPAFRLPRPVDVAVASRVSHAGLQSAILLLLAPGDDSPTSSWCKAVKVIADAPQYRRPTRSSTLQPFEGGLHSERSCWA